MTSSVFSLYHLLGSAGSHTSCVYVELIKVLDILLRNVRLTLHASQIWAILNGKLVVNLLERKPKADRQHRLCTPGFDDP